MPHPLATLAIQPPEPLIAAVPPPSDTAAGMANIAAYKKKRREPDPEFDADFEEICRLIGERFSNTAAPDPEFCRFVGLLPELKRVKDRAFVREAKIIAGYLGRDGIQPPTAQRIIGGLAARLRPFSGQPALHVMFGVLLFFASLLVIDLVLSFFWQSAAWSVEQAIQSPGLSPGFYVFNVSPWLVIAIVTAGGLGSIVSMLTRIQSFAVYAGTDRRLLWTLGAARPVIGIAFALFVFAVLQGQILPFNFTPGPQANFEFVALAFIAGFSERLSRGIISTVEGRFLGEKTE